MVSAGTLIAKLWDEGDYCPPDLWSIVEVMCWMHYNGFSKMLSKVRIGARRDMDDSLKIPAVYDEHCHRFDQLDFIVYHAIQDFSVRHDLDHLFGVICAIAKDKKGHDITHNKESLSRWVQKCGRSNSCIHKYISDRHENINNASKGFSVTFEKIYLEFLFDWLDKIEGHGDDFMIEKAREWKNRIDDGARSAPKRIINDIHRELYRIMPDGKNRPSIINIHEIFPENDAGKILRIMMSVTDLCTNSTYEIWAGIPTHDEAEMPSH